MFYQTCVDIIQEIDTKNGPKEKRIKKYYRRDSAVIYPCVHINEHMIERQPDDYYLIVSRFTYYKRIDLAVTACTKLGRRLLIIGGGEEEKKLRAIAGPTIEFMRTVKKPWVAFKILAAGAIEPRQAFPYAFHNGADFVAVGMFDFQVKDNCDLARRLVEREKSRPRPWCA